MINIHSFLHSLKSSWIKRLKGTQNQWKTAYNVELNKYGGDLIFKCNLSKNDANNIITKYTFLKQIVMSWCKINYKHDQDIISNEIIWHNSKLKK